MTWWLRRNGRHPPNPLQTLPPIHSLWLDLICVSQHSMVSEPVEVTSDPTCASKHHDVLDVKRKWFKVFTWCNVATSGRRRCATAAMSNRRRCGSSGSRHSLNSGGPRMGQQGLQVPSL